MEQTRITTTTSVLNTSNVTINIMDTVLTINTLAARGPFPCLVDKKIPVDDCGRARHDCGKSLGELRMWYSKFYVPVHGEFNNRSVELRDALKDARSRRWLEPLNVAFIGELEFNVTRTQFAFDGAAYVVESYQNLVLEANGKVLSGLLEVELKCSGRLRLFSHIPDELSAVGAVLEL